MSWVRSGSKSRADPPPPSTFAYPPGTTTFDSTAATGESANAKAATATKAALCLLNAFIEEVCLNCWKAKASATCLLYECDPRCRDKSAGWSASTSGARQSDQLSAPRRHPAVRFSPRHGPKPLCPAHGNYSCVRLDHCLMNRHWVSQSSMIGSGLSVKNSSNAFLTPGHCRNW